MASRIDRVSEDIKREIGRMIQSELKDPRLPAIVSVFSMELSNDYRHAKINISVMGNEEEKKKAIEALNSASGYIRREIGKRIRMRNVPELHFKLDDSIEHSIYISELINRTVRPEGKTEGKEDNG